MKARHALLRHSEISNTYRFYHVHIAPTLFGEWSVIREWGRIGCPGTVRHKSAHSEQEAQDIADQIAAAKIRRGYAPQHKKAMH